MLTLTIQYRGWTLLQDPRTKLWSARRGADTLPPTGQTGTLRRLIDQLTGPDVRECCTGEACHG